MPTIEELAALPYGEQIMTGGLTPTHTVEELAALPYLPTPFAQGMTAEDYRTQMRDYGERVRWLQAVESPTGRNGPSGEETRRNGKFYVEATLEPDARVFLYQNTRDVAVEQFGLLARGSAMISFMPDEIDPVRDDRFIALDRTLTSRQTLVPSGNATDALLHREPVSVSAMWAPGEKIDPVRYSIENGLLAWSGAPPTGEVTVIYRYRPHFEWLGENAHQAFLGKDDKRLPGSGPLRLLSAGEE